jgi:hypothetical protein
MAYVPATIKELIQLGGNLKITGQYVPASLREFAQLARAHNTHLTIVASYLVPATLKELIEIAPNNITLEI